MKTVTAMQKKKTKHSLLGNDMYLNPAFYNYKAGHITKKYKNFHFMKVRTMQESSVFKDLVQMDAPNIIGP